MLYSLTVTNSIGESLTFELSKPLASGYAIKNIDGLGTPDMNVNTTPYGIGDGSVLGSIKSEYRLITIVLYPLPLPTVETSRQRLYRYFQVKKPIVLSFNTENRVVSIDGYVQSIEPNIFDNPESIAIEVKCINPYFRKMANGQTNFYGVTPMFEFPFSCDFIIENGIGWSKDAYSGSIFWKDATYGSNKFIGVGQGSPSPIVYSIGGSFWNPVDNADSLTTPFSSIVYGNGRFVALPSSGNQGVYSTDGLKWTKFTLPFSGDWSNIEYGNGRFVAVPSTGNRGAYSTNGTSWTSISLGVSGNWSKLIFGNNTFVLMECKTEVVIYSTNGTTWNRAPLPLIGEWYDIAYGNGIFLITRTGVGTWLRGSEIDKMSVITQGNVAFPCKIGYGNGYFLAMHDDGDEGVYSTDGISWSQTIMPGRMKWVDVVAGDDKTVVLGENGYVTVSGPAISYPDPIEFSSYSIDNRVDIDYVGEIDAGVKITIDCRSTPGDIIIWNVDTLEYIQIFASRVEAVSGSALGPDDIVEISTMSGEKYVRLLRDGVYYNILGAMNRGMTWFTLKQGVNTFTYTTEDIHAAIIISFSYHDTYAAI